MHFKHLKYMTILWWSLKIFYKFSLQIAPQPLPFTNLLKIKTRLTLQHFQWLPSHS